jgi:hypothetical protein
LADFELCGHWRNTQRDRQRRVANGIEQFSEFCREAGRGSDGDFDEAQRAIDRLAALPTEPGFVLHDIWLLRLRALMAQAKGDDATYRDYRDRYRKMATDLGFEGHMAWAEAMP